MSNVSKGNYYKLKTKKWLIGKGYEAEYIERYQTIFTKKGLVHVKQDLFGSDILAMNGQEMVFVQVKFNAGQKTNHVPEALREFGRHKFPPNTKRWVVIWQLRVREPQIVPFVDNLIAD